MTGVREVRVRETTASKAGGCNGCTAHSQDYRVWEISLRSVAVRVCSACRIELLRRLTPAPRAET